MFAAAEDELNIGVDAVRLPVALLARLGRVRLHDRVRVAGVNRMLAIRQRRQIGAAEEADDRVRVRTEQAAIAFNRLEFVVDHAISFHSRRMILSSISNLHRDS